MTSSEFLRYWKPASDRLFGVIDMTTTGPAFFDHYTQLDRALGISVYGHYWDTGTYDDRPIEPWLKELCVLLAGPHGPTILKVYRIQRGLE